MYVFEVHLGIIFSMLEPLFRTQSFPKDSYVKQKDKKENELLAAIIKKPSSIVELKEQVVSSKREILMF